MKLKNASYNKGNNKIKFPNGKYNQSTDITVAVTPIKVKK
jgi:hypothetical protein